MITQYRGGKFLPRYGILILEVGLIDMPANGHQTLTSINIWNCRHNESIFPNPEHFNPKRWLSGSAGNLEKYLVPFGSGSKIFIRMKFITCTPFLEI